MDEQPDRELAEELRAMRRDVETSPDLDRRLLHAARAAGHVTGGRGRRWRQWSVAAAALLAAFLAGWTLGRGSAVAPADPRAQFVLLLHGEGRSTDSVARHTAWLGELRRANAVVRGTKLNGAAADIGPAAAAERISGFFVIRAASLEEAAAIARSCPHARDGGRVEVRPVDPV